MAPVGHPGAPPPHIQPQQQPAHGVPYPTPRKYSVTPSPPRKSSQAVTQHPQGYAQPSTIPGTAANTGGGAATQQQVPQPVTNSAPQGSTRITYNNKFSPEARSKAIRRIHSKLGDASEPVFLGRGGCKVELFDYDPICCRQCGGGFSAQDHEGIASRCLCEYEQKVRDEQS